MISIISDNINAQFNNRAKANKMNNDPFQFSTMRSTYVIDLISQLSEPEIKHIWKYLKKIKKREDSEK